MRLNFLVAVCIKSKRERGTPRVSTPLSILKYKLQKKKTLIRASHANYPLINKTLLNQICISFQKKYIKSICSLPKEGNWPGIFEI